jgi:hypothetical protein
MTSMLKKKNENKKYSETVREREMYQFRNKRKLIEAKPRYTTWVPNMHIEGEFTHRKVETAYLKMRTLDPIGKVPVQDRPFNAGIVQRFVD